MAYEPTNWKSGDVVTSAKLNKLEQGVADSPYDLIVGITVDDTDPASPIITPEIVKGDFQTAFDALTDGNPLFGFACCPSLPFGAGMNTASCALIGSLDAGSVDEQDIIVFSVTFNSENFATLDFVWTADGIVLNQ